MATGRSGQLVVTAAKDPLTSSPSSSRSKHRHHRQHPRSPPTEATYFLQRRFEDTALVVFQQHMRRQKEVSPGHYTPLPSSTPAPPASLFRIPGLDPPEVHEHRAAAAPSGSEKAATGGTVVAAPFDKASPGTAAVAAAAPSVGGTVVASATPGSDKASTSSAASSVRRAGSASPRSGASSAAGGSFRNGSESPSVSSADRAPEDGCERRSFAGGSGNRVWDQGLPRDALTSCEAEHGATAWLSDDSSFASSAPDSDLVDEGPLPGASATPPGAWQTVSENTCVAAGSDGRDRSLTHVANSPANSVSQNGRTVTRGVLAQSCGPAKRQEPDQLQSSRINGATHSQQSSRAQATPPSSSFSERSAEPASLSNGLNGSRRSLRELSAAGGARWPQEEEPVSVSSRPQEADQLSVSSDEEVQITRL